MKRELVTDRRSVVIPIAGKLIGSAARRLWEELETIAEAGVERVILDMTACGSVDSLGEYAVQRALHAGLEIAFVLSPWASVSDLFQDDRVRKTARFGSVEEALEDAGAALVGCRT